MTTTNEAAGAAAAGLVGTWRLVAVEMRGQDGAWVPAPMAGRPIGMITYDARGNMAVQITTDPPRTDGARAPFELENGYLAYFGTYGVDRAKSLIIHVREAQSYARGKPSNLVRHFALEGDTLTLTTVPGNNFRLLWRRAG